MPHKKPLNPTIGSQATFTDREEPQRYFQEALAEIRQREYSLLTFYGVGGIGKSCLSQHLKQAHLDKDDSSIYSWVDFAVPANREPHKTLRALVRNFTGKNRIPFAAFGLAYMI
ncbi:MAG TPA: hypothetical protein EYH19_06690, partial [Desulfocapsa sulfexigens]|nr:hypothetical protein [Desulfocapsa sulfexigens]